MYRFCRITDLVIFHFNFWSKNCISKVYTCFEKVVVLVTQSTTKWSLHFFGFFYDFILNLQVSAQTQKGVKIHFAKGPLELFEPHKTTLAFSTQNPTWMKSQHRGPGGAGELAAGEGSPELAHKRHGTAIELTTKWWAVVARPEWLPTSGGGGTGEARPQLREVRRGERLVWAMRSAQSFSATKGRCYECPMAWRAGGGTSSARAAQRRPRELGLRRASGSVGSTSGRTSSRGVKGRTGCAQAGLGFGRAPSAPWGANGGAEADSGSREERMRRLLKLGARRWGCFLACQGIRVTVWAATWPEYGARGRRRAACTPACGWLGGAAR
jgi:hypothetical protein